MSKLAQPGERRTVELPGWAISKALKTASSRVGATSTGTTEEKVFLKVSAVSPIATIALTLSLIIGVRGLKSRPLSLPPAIKTASLKERSAFFRESTLVDFESLTKATPLMVATSSVLWGRPVKVLKPR